MTERRTDGFQKLALATTGATYLLILVGGLVRATGSGLGCPDWPKCFGLWVPPTSAAELPSGFDPALFNPLNTWIEYVNRLIGVTIGLLIFATMVLAILRHRQTKSILYSSAAAFVLVGFEGWLGAKVVELELASWIVTVHLVGALVVVSLLLYATVCAFFPKPVPKKRRSSWRRSLEPWVVGLLALAFVQVALGTQVRAAIEAILAQVPDLPRPEWLVGVGPVDLAHRQVSVVVFFATAFVAFRTFQRRHDYPWLFRASAAAFALVGLQIVAGLGIAYGGMPAALQVAHLSLGSLLLGAFTLMWLLVHRVPEPNA